MSLWGSRFSIGLGTLLLLVFLLGWLALNLSVETIVPFEDLGVSYDNTRDARLGTGQMRLRLEQYPALGTVALAWNFCPGLSPLSWCFQLETREMQADGRVSLIDGGTLLLRDTNVTLLSLQPLGLAGSTANGRLNANIQRWRLAEVSCPWRQADAAATGQLKGLQIFDGPFGDVNFELRPLETGAQRMVFNGGFLQGQVALAEGGDYSASGELTAPPQLEGLIRNLMRHLDSNRYAWEFSGELAC